MNFRNGYLGACIIVLGIMATIVGSYALSVDVTDEQVTKYEYVTDLTGLFTTEQAPTYISYNPSTNYTGYYTSSSIINNQIYFDGVNYQTSSKANMYRLNIQPSNLTSSTETITGTGISLSNPHVTFVGTRTLSGSTVTYAWGNYTGDNDTLSSIVSNLSIPVGDNVVQIKSNTDLSNITFPHSISTIDADWVLFSVIDWWTTNGSSSALTVGTPDAITIDQRPYNPVLLSCEIDLDRQVARLYTDYDCINAYGEYSLDSVVVSYGGSGTSNNNINFGSTAYVTCMTIGPATYLDITQGVNVNTHNTYWSNKLYNGSVEIAYFFTGSSSYQFTVPLYESSNINDVVTWTQTNYELVIAPSKTRVYVDLYDNGTLLDSASVDIGNWAGCLITVNASTGEVFWTPMNTFTNFTSYTVLETQRELVFSWDETENAAIYEIEHYDNGNGKTRLEVVNTMTYLDTFGVVLNNPSIDMEDKFPQYNEIRLNLYSFATYGDSLTIGGITWPVTGSQITVYYLINGSSYDVASSSTPGALSKTLTLSNIYITWDGTDCLLTFVDDNWTVNLGPYSNGTKAMSFSGLWYFTTALWEPYTATQTVISGDWDSLLDVDKTVVLIVFLGVTILAALICHIKMGLKWLDGVIIAVGLIVSWTLLG